MDGQRVRARELLLRETYTLNVRIWDADHMGKEGDLSNLLGKLNNYYHQGTNMKNLLLNLLTIVLLPVLAIYHALYWLFIVFPRPQQIGVKEYCKNRLSASTALLTIGMPTVPVTSTRSNSARRARYYLTLLKLIHFRVNTTGITPKGEPNG